MREEMKNALPLWGPYSKKYMGISRVMKESRITGARFDLVLHPTYANSAVPAPNVCVPSSYHPWEVAADGTYYSYRYELIWKDELYADVSFFEMDKETWGIRTEYVNHTDRTQNCLLNFFSAIEYPKKQYYELQQPQKSEAWNALDYTEVTFARKRPWEHLQPDGLKKGEVKVTDFTEGTGLGDTYYSFMASHLQFKMFGGDAGDQVTYRRQFKNSYEDAVLLVRYKTVFEGETVVFHTAFGKLEFVPAKTPKMLAIPLGRLEAGEFELTLTAEGAQKNGVVLDCFCITEKENTEEVVVTSQKYQVVPEIAQEGKRICYHYANGEKPVCLSILNDRVRERELHSGCIEDALPTRLSNSDATYDRLTMSFSGSFSEKHSDEGYYHNKLVEAIFVPAQDTRVVYAYIGTDEGAVYSEEKLKARYLACKKACQKVGEMEKTEGRPYQLSVGLLKAVLFSNVVYPIERYGEPIIHYTPGKRWDSLYTWDSGMIGIGMLGYSPERAKYMMDVYLAEQTETFAFLFHGSMVPTQFYLWQALYQKAAGEEKQALLSYYPALKRYYDFFAGKTEGSTTGRYQSGLLTVYDYFYNASGMDDYPPQVEMHKKHLENFVAPVCSSVHLVRIAKFMKEIAKQSGHSEDVSAYEEDMTRVSEALLQYAWDEESGYFGYAVHEKDGIPQDILRTESGENYNKGMDGVTPLIAGIGTKGQIQKMLSHLKSEQELLSPVGLSNVDMSASYYYDNGYWNGSVWFPYQYLMWRAMLDLGEGDFAYEIVKRGLDAWKKETDFSYHTFEMIQIQSERGGWYHQFGGLSALVCSWYQAYFKKGTVTAGFDTWIDSCEFGEDAETAKISYHCTGQKNSILLAVMNEDAAYRVKINGIDVLSRTHINGTLEIPLSDMQGIIEINKAD